MNEEPRLDQHPGKTQWVLLLTVCILGIAIRQAPSDLQAATHTPAKHQRCTLLMVPEDEPWLLLSATAACAQIRHQGQVPLLLAHDANTPGQHKLLQAVLPQCSQHLMVRSCAKNQTPDEAWKHGTPTVVSGKDITAVSAVLAKMFWKQSPEVFLCLGNQYQAGLLGATLAALSARPFIPCDPAADMKDLMRILEYLQVKKLIICGSGNPWAAALHDRFDVEVYTNRKLQDRIVDTLKPNSIRNLVVLRPYDESDGTGQTSWMGPYLCLMRGALPVCAECTNAERVEEGLWQLMRERGLRPRTLTILADYNSLGRIQISDPQLSDYEVEVEVCTYPGTDGMSALGAGRIPCRALSRASTLIAHGFARPVLGQDRIPRVLMIANPSAEYGTLPLAETISRVTAEEFKNAGLAVDEFYGQPSHLSEIRQAAEQADLVVFEGHVSDQHLFRNPEYQEYQDYQDYHDYQEYQDPVYFEDDTGMVVNGESDDDDRAMEAEPDANQWRSTEPLSVSAMTNEATYSEAWAQEPDEIQSSIYKNGSDHTLDYLQGLPLVILQSCHSLEEPVARHIFDLGGIGLIGSTTNMHSGSGSAFIKSVCDGLLYRGLTLGEAVRDARNYFFCLAALKQQRGHQQTAKVYRAGLSFGLWGDPETVLFAKLPRPQRRVIQARFVNPSSLEIKTALNRLPEVRTNRYTARIMPGSAVAGIVKRVQDQEQRKLMPLYFFRLDRPKDFNEAASSLYRPGALPNRAVFDVDPFKRYVYLLYFPNKDIRNTLLQLNFVEPHEMQTLP